MKKTVPALAILAAAAAVSGCSSFASAIGATKIAPDEFRVVTRAPLTLPPDYSLRPPNPGQPRPQELEPDAEARAALFGQDIGQGASQGERTLVNRAGAEAVDPTVRDQVDFDSSNVVHRSQAFADRVLSFQGQEAEAAAPAPADPAEAEARTAEQEAVRRATGGGDVTIEREEGGGFGIKLPGT